MNKYKIKRYFLRFLGKNVYPTLEELRNSGMKIGNNVDIIKSYIDPLFPEMISIGNNVTITNSTLLAHDASLRKIIGFSKFSPIKIGDNVFIGYGSIILPGVTIGNNVIVGAGSVVTKNIPDDYVVAGTPPQLYLYFSRIY
nr:acyltransferase [Prevotella sp.]